MFTKFPHFLRLYQRVYLIGLFLVFPLGASAAITLAGADGHALTLNTPATRIVSLAPALTELVYDVGAGADMVGADAYSNYPAAAKKLRRVGNAFGFDLEEIVALRPDLVLAWQGGTPVKSIERLRALHLPVLVIGARRLTDIAANLELIGKATAHETESHVAAQTFLAGLDKLRSRYTGRKPVRVFYEISATPLYTIGGKQIISHLIELCGGRNIFRNLTALAAPVSFGVVLARDPQAIVTGAGPGSAARLKQWQRWPQISAVKTRNLFRISGDLLTRATPRMLEGGKQLCTDLERARRYQGRLAG